MNARERTTPELGAGLLEALRRLETGDCDVSEARTIMKEITSTHRDVEGASEVFASLRSWIGRLLRSSAGGQELREWHSLMKATAAQFRGDLQEWSIRINVLSDLVYERAGMAETRSAVEVLERRHARRLLNAIAGTGSAGRVERAELGRVLQLEQANLTRVCTMLLDAGLVARHEAGRTVSFELTATGAMHARPVEERSDEISDAAPVDGDVWRGMEGEMIDVVGRPATEEPAAGWSHYREPETVWKDVA